MKCARCGGEIPEGSPSCPVCGLKIRMRAPVAGTAAPAPGQPGPSPTIEAYPEQELPPGAIEVSGPSAPGEWPPRDLRAGPASKPYQVKRKTPKALVAIIVIGLLVIGGAAAAYFLLIRKTSASGPEVIIERCLRAEQAGDWDTARSYYTPEAKEVMDLVYKMWEKIDHKEGEIKELEVKTIIETERDAEVEIVNYKIIDKLNTGSMETDWKALLLEEGYQHLIYHLIKTDGKWLITGYESR